MTHRKPTLPPSPFMVGDRVIGSRPSNVYERKLGTVDRILWLDSTGWHVNVLFDDGTETAKFVSHTIFSFASSVAA